MKKKKTLNTPLSPPKFTRRVNAAPTPSPKALL